MKIVRTKDVPWAEGMQRAISVSKGVDVTEYPDSGKVHAAALLARRSDRRGRRTPLRELGDGELRFG
jgi:hypothetical protein